MSNIPHEPATGRFRIISYENNWAFARSLLCRKYVKDVTPDASGVCFEDPDLMKFELFLNAAAKRKDLSFVSMGLSTCDGKLLASKGVASHGILLQLTSDFGLQIGFCTHSDLIGWVYCETLPQRIHRSWI